MPLPLIWLAIGAIGTYVAKRASDSYSDSKASEQKREYGALIVAIEADALVAHQRFSEFATEFANLRKELLRQALGTIQSDENALEYATKSELPEKVVRILKDISVEPSQVCSVPGIVIPAESREIRSIANGGMNLAKFNGAREIGAAIAIAASVVDSVKRLNTVYENEKTISDLRIMQARNAEAFKAAEEAYCLEISLLGDNFTLLSGEVKAMHESGMHSEAREVASILRAMLGGH